MKLVQIVRGLGVRIVPAQVFWAALAVTTVWKIYAASTLGVCDDEAYYWYWSLFPQLSYFDHPPLTAWAMSLAGMFFGDSRWTIRVVPILAGVLFVAVGRALATAMYGEKAGLVAGTLLLLVPIFLINGLIITPDTLLALAWICSLYCVWQALGADGGRQFAWWAALGVCAGLGALSKYTMVLFYASLGGLLLAMPESRRKVLKGSCIAGTISLLVFSPVLVWNSRFDWISFKFQFGHGLVGKTPRPLGETLGNYLGGLLLTASPLLFIAAVIVTFKALSSPDRRERFLAVFFWPTILFFLYAATKTWVQANWPTMALVSAVILLAGQWHRLLPGWRAAVISVLLIYDVGGLLYLSLPRTLSLRLKKIGLKPSVIDQFHGGQDVAAIVESTKDAIGADGVITYSHQLFSSLAFYSPELRDNLLLQSEEKPRFPWLNRNEWEGRDVLLANWGPWDPEDLPKARTIELVRVVNIAEKGDTHLPLYIYYANDYLP